MVGESSIRRCAFLLKFIKIAEDYAVNFLLSRFVTQLVFIEKSFVDNKSLETKSHIDILYFSTIPDF